MAEGLDDFRNLGSNLALDKGHQGYCLGPPPREGPTLIYPYNVDLRKAFDSVRWDFLEAVMLEGGLGLKSLQDWNDAAMGVRFWECLQSLLPLGILDVEKVPSKEQHLDYHAKFLFFKLLEVYSEGKKLDSSINQLSISNVSSLRESGESLLDGPPLLIPYGVK
ncbi:hypothetical protein QJS10_CPB14g01217 [Acorus calamus]|uniref:Uncharacterized protein n=1 Tax=Acorus calamus TaxID=4465 RepID=A0AAV9D9S9_ACOCL|nr:hypothetical protein QJS10_CPB14g01217 [Acorus calamus]